MKGLGILAAVAGGLMALTPAPASAYRGTPVGLETGALVGSAALHETGRRHWDDRRGRGWNRGRGWRNQGRWRWRSVCRTEWRNGRRDRVCRRIRYRG